MHSTKISNKIQNKLEESLSAFPLLPRILKDLQAQQARTYLVGGAVRDLLLERSLKDIDIEVHGMSLDALTAALSAYGVVDLVGKSFGVLKLHGLPVDWSIPRSDSAGRRPAVNLDPSLSLEQALARRDLTINAMAIDLADFTLIDPFNGYADLHAHILRAPAIEKFSEDPLRFYRVMQFAARFEMDTDPTLTAVCASMDISTVSRERIEQEFAKWLLKSAKPSLGLNWLVKVQRLKEVLPEIAATQGVLQEYKWHPEGDVFEHTKQTIDAAASMEYDSSEQKLIGMYAALCHDIGKPVCTTYKDNRIISYGHAEKGALIVKKLLKRIGVSTKIERAVVKLVNYHMHPGQFVKSNASSAAYKKLALRLAPEVTIKQLALLFAADRLGRNPERGAPLKKLTEDVIGEFIRKAQQAGVYVHPEKAVLEGEDLLPFIGPGPRLGALLKQAYQIQINKGIKDKERLLALIGVKKKFFLSE
jgi:tRNA nucleotidyltransferase (CCA-adding enzyme)